MADRTPTVAPFSTAGTRPDPRRSPLPHALTRRTSDWLRTADVASARRAARSAASPLAAGAPASAEPALRRGGARRGSPRHDLPAAIPLLEAGAVIPMAPTPIWTYAPGLRARLFT